jgi:Protein of unknown function (DUF3450)
LNHLRLTGCTLGLLMLSVLLSSAFVQAGTDEVIAAGQERLQQNQTAQEKVDQLHEQSGDLAEEYQTRLKEVEGLKVYNQILAKQLNNQANEMTSLDGSIANAAVIERQILPLLTRMLDSLDQFVKLDLPFLAEERSARVKHLRTLIEDSGLSNAEKTRRVFEAFQIENDYGNTIESYKGKLDIDTSTYDVDFLRVGRVSLAYRSVGGQYYGYWDVNAKKWVRITVGRYQRDIDKGIKMARQEMAPELITIPLVPAKES